MGDIVWERESDRDERDDVDGYGASERARRVKVGVGKKKKTND